jgi:hypothetical protein
VRTKYKDIVTLDWDHGEVFITIDETTEDTRATAGMTVDQALKFQAQLAAMIRKALRPMPEPEPGGTL